METYKASPIDSVLALWDGCIEQARRELAAKTERIQTLQSCADAIRRNLQPAIDEEVTEELILGVCSKCARGVYTLNEIGMKCYKPLERGGNCDGTILKTCFTSY